MRILVTGAAGFIASHVVASLVGRGHDVWGIDAFRPSEPRDRKERHLENARGAGAWQFEERDVGSLTPVELAGIGAVIHLAGQAGVRESWENFDAHLVDNLGETHTLARLVADAGIPRLVFASSSAVYGEATEYPVRETTAPIPRSPYGVTKLAGESLLEVHAFASSFDAVALRLFTVFGPGQRNDMAIARLIESALTGAEFPMYGDGSQRRNFVYVADAVRAFVASVEHDVPPGLTRLNIGAQDDVALRELVRLVEEESGATIRVRSLPEQVGDVTRTGADNTRAREILGWEPLVTLRDGIAQQITYARNPDFTTWSGPETPGHST